MLLRRTTTIAAVALTVAAGLMLAGCSGTPAKAAAARTTASAAPATFWLNGTVSAPIDASDLLTSRIQNTQGASCYAGANYTDIKSGAQVVVTDQGGTTIATGTLSGGQLVAGASKTAFDATCRFQFSVAAPKGKTFYGVHVGNSNRATQQYSPTQASGGIALTVGN